MLKDKARINLKAGEALAVLGLTDPATSRYYYALYQAAVHALTRHGWTPDRLRSGAVQWSHDMVMNNASLVRGRSSDRALVGRVRDLRIAADYGDRVVEPHRLAAEAGDVRRFVEEVTT
jgi:hypothetical protein